MNKSESLANIAKALVAIEKDIKNPKATKENPFFHSKYAPLDAILEENRTLLAKNGLVLLQDTGINTTMILHTSGEFIESSPMDLNHEPQKIGSGATYGRRYSLSGMLGIASEDDDDANAVNATPERQSTTTTNTPRVQEPKPISEKQLGYLHSLTKDLGFTDEDKDDLKKEYGVESTKDLTSSDAHKIIDDLKARVEKLVQADVVEDVFGEGEVM